MGATWSQLFPPAPNYTEKDLPDLHGKVFLITGGASGIGFELSKILYNAGAKVYIAGRSESDGQVAIDRIRSSQSQSDSSERVVFLHLDLADLATIKPAVDTFKAKESRLDVLWNNAGVSLPPAGSVSKQGTELMVATNCVGPHLLTQLLLPLLRDVHEKDAEKCGRVIWTSSIVVDSSAPSGGIKQQDLVNPSSDQTKNYALSKTGNWFLASELGRNEHIISVTLNPGQLKTNLLRHAPRWMTLLSSPLLHEARLGAYTELWAGLSEQVTVQDNGRYIIPWGRFHPSPRQDLLAALKSEADGGTGQALKFKEWCDSKVADYL